MSSADLFSRPPASLDDALAIVAAINAALTTRGLTLRPAPAVPTTCCERGCAGCVWEGYATALARWRTDAGALLNAPADNSHTSKRTPCASGSSVE